MRRFAAFGIVLALNGCPGGSDIAHAQELSKEALIVAEQGLPQVARAGGMWGQEVTTFRSRNQLSLL